MCATTSLTGDLNTIYVKFVNHADTQLGENIWSPVTAPPENVIELRVSD